MRFAPSRREYSEWQWRWTKDILERIATATRCCQSARLDDKSVEVTEKKRVRWVRRVWRTLAVVVLAIVAYLVIAPTGRYLLRAAWEEGKILSRRRSIPELIADAATPVPLRAKLELVL